MYFYINSEASIGLYPANKADHFRFKLPRPIKMQCSDSWELALLDLDMPGFLEKNKPTFIVIQSSVLVPSVYGTSLQPILHRLYYDEVKWGSSFRVAEPQYVQVNVSTLDVLDIHIYDQDGAGLSLKSGALHCALHLRKKPKSTPAYANC